jgi:hypothetical protein
MSIKTGITAGTPSKILFGAGVYFHGLEYSETVAPTEEAIKAAIIGATQEGGTLTITPEFFAPELDGATVSVMELQQKVGETAQMDISYAELTAELMSKMVIGAVGESTGGEYDVVTSSVLKKDHFYKGFGFYGEFLDGRPIIILFKNALCTSGFTTDSKNKTNSIFKGTMACQSDIEYGTTKLPYAIFIRKKDGWTSTDASDLVG